jgi:hypothetical protein
VPEALTENFAVLPGSTVMLSVCELMVGAVAAAVTVRVATELVALPALLVTTTVKFEPLSEEVVEGVV